VDEQSEQPPDLDLLQSTARLTSRLGEANLKCKVYGHPGGFHMPEEPEFIRDMRFCPYCYQQSFDMSETRGEWVYCEMCGIDVEVKELVKQ
jgi:hypothetical protein